MCLKLGSVRIKVVREGGKCWVLVLDRGNCGFSLIRQAVVLFSASRYFCFRSVKRLRNCQARKEMGLNWWQLNCQNFGHNRQCFPVLRIHIFCASDPDSFQI
jgi:hypothetical protein